MRPATNGFPTTEAQRDWRHDRRRGATLLIAIGILTLLTLFALTFSRLMNFERQASSFYRDSVRARMAARAGIHRAIVELQRLAGQAHYDIPWNGPVATNANIQGGLWGYREVAPPGFDLQGRPVDLLTTMAPSFATADDGHGDPTKVKQMFGNPLIYSGDLGEPYGAKSRLIYKLKVVDAASQINLNHPDPFAAARMLKNVLRAAGISGYEAKANNAIFGQATAPNPIGFSTANQSGGRPSWGFRSKPEIRAALEAGGLTGAEWEVINNFVTAYSWEDPSVIRPYQLNDPTFGFQSADNGNPGVADDIHLQTLNPMPRAPVNLNTAGFEVLVGLLAELKARNDLGEFTISYEAAVQVAQRILERRQIYYRTWDNTSSTADDRWVGPFNTPDLPPFNTTAATVPAASRFNAFRSWPEVESFIDGVPVQFGNQGCTWTNRNQPFVGALYTEMCKPSNEGGQVEAGFRDLIKAALNPNTMLTKFGQLINHGGWKGRAPRTVDKSDLVHMTTEGCFSSMGVFEITSLGLILFDEEKEDSAGQSVGMTVVAAQTQVAVVEVFKPFRLTTQQDFEEHRALQVEGNLIECQDSKWAAGGVYPSRGHNQQVFFDNYAVGSTSSGNAEPTFGWPGVVTWPSYSVDRLHDSTRATARPAKPEYQMASYDGSLALTNLVGVKTADPDFIAGFSRGRLDAFKGRAYWQPKHEDPTGAPENIADGEYLGVDMGVTKIGGSGIAGLLENTAPMSFTSYGDFGNYPFNYGDMTPSDHASNRAPLVRSVGSNFGEAAVLDEDPSNDNPPGLFVNGTALWNTGCVVAPDRVVGTDGYQTGNRVTGAGNEPRFLAYDGDNLDLVRGTSIRFWVQPLIDPFVKQREVLVSFMGDITGAQRLAGFRLVKEVALGRVLIVLESAAPDDYVPEDYCTYAGQKRLVDWDWSRQGRIQIDVTPVLGSLNDPYVDDPSANAGSAGPKWMPRRWHYVAVDLGRGRKSFDGPPEYFASLRVDGVVTTAKLDYRGGGVGLTQDGADEFGELLAYVDGASLTPASFVAPFGPATAGTTAARGWLAPRQLGDFFHCQANKGQPAGNTGLPGVHVVSTRKTFGGLPADGGSCFRWVGSDWIYFPFSFGGAPGSYQTTAAFPNPVPFPVLSYHHRMEVECLDAGGAVKYTHPMVRQGNGTWTLNPPSQGHVFYGIQTWPDQSPVPRANPPYSYPCGYPDTSGVPPNEWYFRLVIHWDEDHYLVGSPFCVDDPSVQNFISIERETDPALATFGEGMSYCCHNSGATFKNGFPISRHPSEDKRSWVRTKQPLPYRSNSYFQTVTSFPDGSNMIPLTYLDDDCHGCEDCDVDGPVFIGGEPTADRDGDGLVDNYLDPAAMDEVAPIDPATMAYAVFDNVVFINGDEARRTDWPGATDRTTGVTDPLTGETIDFTASNLAQTQDRFYETTLRDFIQVAANNAGAPPAEDSGAVYHRALLELQDLRVRLGTFTWTTYRSVPEVGGLGSPTSGMNFQVGLWKIDNEVVDISTGRRVFSPGNTGVIDVDQSTWPGGTTSDTSYADSAEEGYSFYDPLVAAPQTFDPEAIYDGPGGPDQAVEAPELLILGVRLRRAAEDNGTAFVIAPLRQTPVFEDFTLTYVLPGARIRYIEEGGEE